MEATAAVAAKSKKFLGLKKFASVAAKRKQDAAKRKEEEAVEIAAEAAAVTQVVSKSRRSMLSMLEVELPPVEKQNVRSPWLSL